MKGSAMVQPSLPNEPLKVLIILSLCVLTVWALYLVAMLYGSDQWETRAFFGEMFGSLDSLFSGLAFAGLIYAIWLQRKELQLQRDELRQTREELQRTANAQEQSKEALTRQADTLLFTARLNLISSRIELKLRKAMSSSAIDPFFDEMERELNAIKQDFQRREDSLHGPRNQ
jgi:hypothetical protein